MLHEPRYTMAKVISNVENEMFVTEKVPVPECGPTHLQDILGMCRSVCKDIGM